ncbi:MAG TPA: hypothetical protein VGN01_09540 [Acidobacteriaceae bacterium]|jgi:hypothetical protein
MTHSTPNTPAPDPMDHALDRMLDARFAVPSDELTPSSGFVASVMDSIHAEAIEPPPIAFPWGRVIPGAAAILCGLIALVVFVVRTAREVSAPPHLADLPTRVAQGLFAPSAQTTFAWMLLAAGLSVAAVFVSFRLTRHRE